MRSFHFSFSPAKPCLHRLSLVCIAIAACAASAPAGAVPTYTLIDVPGGGNTYATAINSDGTIAGGYGSVDQRHGFVRTADGTFTKFDPEGSVYTAAVAINNKGRVAGFFIDANEIDHAFIRNPDGHI